MKHEYFFHSVRLHPPRRKAELDQVENRGSINTGEGAVPSLCLLKAFPVFAQNFSVVAKMMKISEVKSGMVS